MLIKIQLSLRIRHSHPPSHSLYLYVYAYASTAHCPPPRVSFPILTQHSTLPNRELWKGGSRASSGGNVKLCRGNRGHHPSPVSQQLVTSRAPGSTVNLLVRLSHSLPPLPHASIPTFSGPWWQRLSASPKESLSVAVRCVTVRKSLQHRKKTKYAYKIHKNTVAPHGNPTCPSGPAGWLAGWLDLPAV